ncbi:hypothetical protein ACFXHA_33330 [Nocardia sp. NPDC059240]|uniref:hypothetical protein n=1 Tax=Nocardia sp. NPDC059240 TaxID=3346786 RepID=UPI003692A5F8
MGGLWGRRIAPVLAVAIGIGLVGCSGQHGDSDPGAKGSAPTSTTAVAPPVSPVDTFGWDPCGYLTPELYADVADHDPATGLPRVQIDPVDFDLCEVHIVVPGPTYHEISVASNKRQTPPTPGVYDNADRYSVAADGDWTVVTQKQENMGSCLRAVYSAQSAVTITSSQDTFEKALPVDVCDLTDRAEKALVAALHANSVPRLSFPADSLGRTDSCALLTDAEITANVALPGWNPPAARHPGHFCLWQATESTAPANMPVISPFQSKYNLVSLMPGLNKPAASGRTVTIAGVPTVLSGGTQSCTATVAGRTWQPWPGKQVYQARYPQPDTLVESLQLAVVLADTGDACQAVQNLAEKAWPRLR